MRPEVLKKALSLLLIPVMALVMMAASEVHSHAASGKYWIKVNKKKCVATAYKKVGGKWKPYRAMICSVGKSSTPTPSGTFRMGAKFRWIQMVTEGVTTFEQYTTRFYGQYYLHSPCYAAPRKNKQKAHTYFTLGKHVTHGCVRFSVMDAKWIYENCGRGTKVTVYRSSDPGPLGKPEKVNYVKKHGRAWDPTDPDKKNPVFRMRAPKFTISKKKDVLYGTGYALKKGVKVVNPNANQNLTGKMKVLKLTRNGKAISVKSFSTRKLGEYKVTYYVKDKYCIKKGGKGTARSFLFRVMDKTTFSGASDKTAEQEEVLDLLKGVKAKSLSKDLTGSIKVKVTEPDGSKKTLSRSEAQSFVVSQPGEYEVTYSVENPYPKKTVSKTITVVVNQSPENPETP